jgi:RNA polymerase sigma-70 factor (ECF subfamily)
MPPIVRRDGPSDKTILRRARQGDRQSFLTLLRRYDPRLRRLALRLLADPSRLERVLSRAYLKAWRSLPFLKRGELPAGWLYRIVYNTCINEMRWEPPRPAPPRPDGPSVPLPAASIEQRLLALRALRGAERIPLVLVDAEGLSLEAAARMMRREPVDVAADLTRARGRWRAFVSGEPEPPPDSAPTPPVVVESDRRGRPKKAPAPSPAATMAKLAALAAPSAPREPGGHVKLLASRPGGRTPPPVAAKPPRARQGGTGAGTRSANGVQPEVEHPTDDATPGAASAPGEDRASDADAAPKTDHGPPSGTGTGARRKRRRDAKRAVRSRGRGGAPLGADNPASNPTRDSGTSETSRDDRDPS